MTHSPQELVSIAAHANRWSSSLAWKQGVKEAAGTETSQILWGRVGAGFRAVPGQVKRWRGRGGVGGDGGRSLTGSAWSWPSWQENRRRWGSVWDAGCGATPHLTTRNYGSQQNENKEEETERKTEWERENRKRKKREKQFFTERMSESLFIQ